MHPANVAFWKECSRVYPRYFNDPSKVLEVGSRDLGGTIRTFFKCSHYIGIDWKPGNLVDLVCLAHEMKFGYLFNNISSASMLEHDPYWEASITKMVGLLDPEGILILTWGAALNSPHCFEEAPDGQFHALPAGKVLNLLNRLGVYIHLFKYESNLEYARDIVKVNGGIGEVCLIGFLNKSNAIGEQDVDPFLKEDK